MEYLNVAEYSLLIVITQTTCNCAILAEQIVEKECMQLAHALRIN